MSAVDDATTNTLPKLARRNARIWSKDPGMREKDRGIWQTFDWSAYYSQVSEFALGLAALGFSRDDKLSVVGDNRARLYWAMVSAQALGGQAVPVYQDSIANELVYVLNHAEVAIIVAEDQEQVDKVLSLRDQLPNLKWVIYDDPRGMSDYDVEILKSYDDVQEIGREFGAKNPDYFEAEVDKGLAGDVALIAYTSGTTGHPKGVQLSHGSMIVTAENFVAAESVQHADNWLAYLPMAWVGDTVLSLATTLVTGASANCPENPETVQRDLRELGPTAILGPPRIWENMLTSVQVRAADATWLKRSTFNYFRAVAARRELLASSGKAVPLMTRLLYGLGEFLIYGPVRDQLGLNNARWCMTGGAPLGADTFRFFRAFGVNLKQVYGATEASALVAFHRDGEVDPNTVGRTIPGVEVRIDENGEVLLKGPGLFSGYFKQAEATRDAFTADGWLRTGDAGFIDPQGHIAIIDRAKDVGKLKDGTPFAPQFIENKLKFSPYIREAVAFGNSRDFVTALIAIDIETVGNWAERRNIPYTSYMDLSRKPEVAELILSEVSKINETLPGNGKAARILLLNKDLEADDAEVTRTRKVRRAHVAEKYDAVLDAFYGGADAVDLTTEITFEDGRKSEITSNIEIHDVAGVLPATATQEAA
jgi:long-chain acyl-CoA synthetase